MKLATITHSAEGVRIAFGDGVVHTYANVTYVAESLANTMHERTELRNRLDKLREAIRKDESAGSLIAIIDGDVPF